MNELRLSLQTGVAAARGTRARLCQGIWKLWPFQRYYLKFPDDAFSFLIVQVDVFSDQKDYKHNHLRLNVLVFISPLFHSKIVRFALFEALHYPTSALGSLIGLDDVMERIMLNFNIVQFTL